MNLNDFYPLGEDNKPIEGWDNIKKYVLLGKEAIDFIEKFYNTRLDDVQRYIVEKEGFMPKLYFDDVGVLTFGVGQTGRYIFMPFPSVFREQERIARHYIPSYDVLPIQGRKAIMSLQYRGDLGLSKKTRSLFNKGKYLEAAKELLNNKEYEKRRARNPRDGVVLRLQEASKFIASLEKDYG